MKKSIYFLLFSFFLFTSCEKDTIETEPVLEFNSKSGVKVDVCHKGDNEIIISINAVETHRAHGDAVDMDGDGYFDKENICSDGIDCDDTNPNINPGMDEICDNGIDDNCDGEVDENCGTDEDNDGFTVDEGDCDDTDSTIYPGATEICGDEVDQDCDGSDLECPSVVDIRIAISNTTSGNYFSYDLGHGIRLMQGVDADILLVQECLYGSNTPTDLQAFTNLVIGSGYYSIGSGLIPNAIVSRYPVIDEGSIVDPAVSNRDIHWAVLDIPGDTNMIAYSVHFLNDQSSQYTAFDLIKDHVSSLLAASELKNYYCIVGGTFNTESSTIVSTMVANSAFEMPISLPIDQNGDVGTTASRSDVYDNLLFDEGLNDLEITTTYGNGESYPYGMVFDSRMYDQAMLDSWFSPALTTDSEAPNMQHMMVVRTVSIYAP